MIRRCWLPGAIALLLILASSAQAQSALDRDTVTRWIAAAEEKRGWVEVRSSAPSHGFHNADEWGNISARITMGTFDRMTEGVQEEESDA